MRGERKERRGGRGEDREISLEFEVFSLKRAKIGERENDTSIYDCEKLDRRCNNPNHICDSDIHNLLNVVVAYRCEAKLC